MADCMHDNLLRTIHDIVLFYNWTAPGAITLEIITRQVHVPIQLDWQINDFYNLFGLMISTTAVQYFMFVCIKDVAK